MNDITFFNYHGSDIRTVEVNNEFWWVLADICKALELSNASIVANRLDEDEVTKLDLGGQTGITNLINESGLYSVILRSDKPQAKPFRHTKSCLQSENSAATGSHTFLFRPPKVGMVKML